LIQRPLPEYLGPAVVKLSLPLWTHAEAPVSLRCAFVVFYLGVIEFGLHGRCPCMGSDTSAPLWLFTAQSIRKLRPRN
jgi:hypothetical protein